MTSSSTSSSQHGPHASKPHDPASRGSRWGRFVPLAVVLVCLVELAILIAIGVNTSLWWAVLVVVIGWIIGLALLVAAGQQSFTRLRSLFRALGDRGDVQDHLSRPAFTLLSALLFFFPGVLTDLAGLVLLLTPVQRRTVKAMGLSSGSEGARKVLYHRSGSGIIDGEIVLENRRTDREDPPPTIIQG